MFGRLFVTVHCYRTVASYSIFIRGLFLHCHFGSLKSLLDLPGSRCCSPQGPSSVIITLIDLVSHFSFLLRPLALQTSFVSLTGSVLPPWFLSCKTLCPHCTLSFIVLSVGPVSSAWPKHGPDLLRGLSVTWASYVVSERLGSHMWP